MASSDIVLIGSDLRRLGTCVRLSSECRQTLQVNVFIGQDIGHCCRRSVWLAAGAMIAALLHNLSTLLVLEIPDAYCVFMSHWRHLPA